VGELGGVHGLEAVLTAVCLQAKDKALRNRSKVAQGREKLQHAQRQEVSRGRASVAGGATAVHPVQAAQARREEKKRQEKEKMMLEDDPEKTRKWEVRIISTFGSVCL